MVSVQEELTGRPEPPIVTIDFEASGLHGYPIEVGLAQWTPGTTVIRTWSTLIRPIQAWIDAPLLWDPNAEAIHRINQMSLTSSGMDVGDVARRLNDLVEKGPAFCDGGTIDEAFCRQLFKAAGVKPTFTLGTMLDMCRRGRSTAAQIRAVLARIYDPHAEIEHRAGPDAVRLLGELATETVREVTVRPLV